MIRTFVVFFALLFGSCIFAQIPIKDVSTIKEPFKLNGSWGFAEQQALFPNQTDTITQTLHLPNYLENKHNNSMGVATFVIDLNTTPNKPLSIDLNPLVNAWKLFVDDTLACESGVIDTKNEMYIASPMRQIVSFTPTTTKTRITLWVANSQHRHFGIGVSPQIAPAGILEASHSYLTNLNIVIVSILLATGFYHLGLFFAWRQDKAPLWFGLFLIVFSARIATTSQKVITIAFDTITWELMTRIEYISGYLSLPLFILYIGTLYHKQSIKAVENLNLGIGIVLVVSVLFSTPLFFTSLLPFTQLIILESIIFVAWVLYRAFREGEKYSSFAFGSFLIFGLTAFHDVLMFSMVIDDTHDWGPFGFIFYLFSQVQILLQRYASAFHTLQKNENELEQIIEKRTSELSSLLTQRELLMRELSHRVKNNLQFIIGLLWTKRANASRETNEILFSLQSQIKAIAAVHETLCSQPNITTVNGGDYLQTINNALRELYADVEFSCNFSKEGFLSMDDAISLGLVVSELVSNSIKHAFSTQHGVIYIDFEITQNMAKLSYSDNKTIFLEDAFISASTCQKSVGWSMILQLIQQLQAQTSIKNNFYIILFKADKELC